MYDIDLAMCSTDATGEDVASSLDYVHMHFSLVPRNVGVHHGVVLEAVEPHPVSIGEYVFDSSSIRL